MTTKTNDDGQKTDSPRSDREEQFRLLFDTMNEGVCLHEIVYDASGKPMDYMILDVNRAYQRLTGISAAEARNRNASELYKTGEAPFLNIYAQVAETGISASFETFWAPLNKHFLISAFSPQKGRFATVFSDFTGQKNDEARLRKSEQKYRQLFEKSTDAVFIVEKSTGRYLDANAAAEALTGYPSAALKELTTQELMPAGRDRQIEISQSTDTARDLGEVVYLRPDGMQRTARLSMVPLDDKSVFGIARDITDQKLAETALRESERKMRSIFRAAPIGIGVVQDRIIREVNERFCDISGYSREDLIGKSSRILYPTNADFEYVGHEKYRQIRERGTGSVETRFRCKDGRIIHVLMRSSPLDPSDLSAGVTFTALDITDRKCTEERLRQSEQKYKIIANFTYDWEFWLRPTGDLEFIAPACERITGFPPEAFYQTPSLLWSIVHEDDRPAVNLHLEATSERSAEPCSLDFRIVTADGRVKWIHHHSLPVYADDGTFLGRRASNRDITERKGNEEKLKASEQRFRELFNNMGSGVAVYSSPDDGQQFLFKDMNQSGLNHAKKTKADVVGRDVREVFPGVEALGLHDVFKRVWATGIPERHPSSLYTDNQLTLWVENYVCKLPTGELVAIYEDTTAKHQAEEARARLEKQIQQAQKLESLGVLAGGIAHDFNNILFPIQGMSEMLMEDLPAESEEHASATEIFHAARRAGDLVKQILSFSRQAELKKLPTRFQLVLKEVVKLIRSTIPSNIAITHAIQNDCGPIMADPTQLHQIAMNLITNAYHAVEPTAGSITIGLDEIVIDGDASLDIRLPSGRYARFSVADTGCGIDPAVKDKIFEPYFTTKVQGKGTGLGLAVVYGIVKDHHGDIRVTSHPGKGTTMEVYLPVLESVPVDLVPAETAANETGTERILLVDDEAQVSQMERQFLERSGYRVTCLTDSIEALDVFRRTPDAFDLVITDITMPNMTGDQLARDLLAIRPDLRIIVCTGFSERISHEKAAAMGVRGFLMKPIARAQLIQTVRRVLDEGDRDD